MSDEKMAFGAGAEFTIPVSLPLKLDFTPEGGLKIKCYQAVGTLTTPIEMVLSFDPRAAGGLVKAILGKIADGSLTVEESSTKSQIQ